jgi:ubiquinone biosynthesis protein
MAQINVTDIGRVSEILGVLTRHGFGRLVIQAGLGRYMPEDDATQGDKAHWTVRVRQALGELGPTYVKLGQILSVRPDIIPARLAAELEQLQDRVPPVPFAAIREVVEDDLHAPIEEIFASFEEQPMASASIAQVHRASLPDGTPVAVKVRRPDIVATVQADLRILYTLARLVEGRLALPGIYTPANIVSEFDAALNQELDFFQEATSCERFRAAIALKLPDLVVPRVHRGQSGRRVLTLELLEGRPFHSIEASDPDAHALAHKLIEASYTQVFETGLFHGDPHPGNLMVLPDGRLGYLDFGLVGTISAEMQQVVSSIFMAMVFKDADGLLMAFTRAGASRGRLDLKALKAEIEHEMAKLHGASLMEMTQSANLMNYIEIITRHGLVMPKEYAVLARTTNLVFGISRKLLPDQDIIEEVRPLAERLVTKQLAPDHMAAEAAKIFLAARSGVSQLPLQATQLLSDLEAGRVQIDTRNPEQDALLTEIRQAGLRISMAMCVLALSTAGAIMLSAAETRILGLKAVPVMGVFTILGSSVLWAMLVAHTQLAGLFSFEATRRGLGSLLRFFFSGIGRSRER